MTKKTGWKSVKKILQKRENYDTLYKKLEALFAEGAPLGLLISMRTGSIWEEIRASTTNGDIFFKRNLRQTCIDEEKLTL